MAFLYNVLKSTTMALLASVVSGIVVVTMFILWFIWAAREVHIFRKLAKGVKEFIVKYSQPLVIFSSAMARRFTISFI